MISIEKAVGEAKQSLRTERLHSTDMGVRSDDELVQIKEVVEYPTSPKIEILFVSWANMYCDRNLLKKLIGLAPALSICLITNAKSAIDKIKQAHATCGDRNM